MNKCCAPRLGRSATILPSSPSMRPLRTCGFSRPCASALLFFFFLVLCALSLLHFLPLLSPHLPLHLPFNLPNHQLSFILQIKVESSFTGNHLTHSLLAATHRRMELTSNIISLRAIYNNAQPFSFS